MPLSNVIVTNFSQSGILPEHTTGSNEHNNTMPRSGLITLTPSSSTDNPSGGSPGYWGLCTSNLTISGAPGWDSGKWTTSLENTTPWCDSSNPLINTDYDPGGLPEGQSIFYSGDRLIGYDFWQYNLLQENGEVYTPTAGFGNAWTHYRWWSHTLQQVEYSYQPWYDEFVAKWPEQVKSVVAVNSMPMNPDLTAQQGNKVFVVIVLKDNVEGMSVINLNNQTLRIDIDGAPDFIEFSTNGMPTDGWSTGTPEQDADVDVTGQAWYNNTSNSDEDAPDPTDGVDADQSSGGVDSVVEETVDLSFGDSEEDEAWGNSGLSTSEIAFNNSNVSSYNGLANSAADYNDIDYNAEGCDYCDDDGNY